MKRKLTNHGTRIIGVACVAFGAICWNGANICNAQTPANLSPPVQEVVKLTKAQMGDDVIVSYVQNSGTTFQLSADDIIYLKEQGVSQTVISALVNAKAAVPGSTANLASVAPPQPAPASYTQQPAPPAQAPMVAPPGMAADQTPPPAPPAQDASPAYFHEQLAPFGTWVVVGGVEYWRPDQALAANPDWRPYYDMGKWVETDNGLFWQSDYTWGDIPFHYGRWVRDPGMGWLWAPDYEWGPAWVFWRHAETDGAVGWAPLPVGAVFVDGAFMFRGARVGLDFDFGLGEACFTFVDFDHFHEGFFRMRGREFRWHIHGDRFHDFYRRSVVRNEFRRDEHGRFVNHGIGRERMAQATRGRVERSSFEERKPVGDRNALAGRAGKAGEKAGGKPGGQASSGAGKVFRPPASTATKTAAASPSSTRKK